MAMTTTTTTSSPTFLCSFQSPLASKSSLYYPQWHILKPIQTPFSSFTNSLSSVKPLISNSRRTHLCSAGRRKPTDIAKSSSVKEEDDNLRRILQIGLWGAEVVYIWWLFLLPYAPVGTFFVLNYVSLVTILYDSQIMWISLGLVWWYWFETLLLKVSGSILSSANLDGLI
jgi:hypothetical protein